MFENVLVHGIPLVVVVIGLVEWFKSFGLAGNILRGISMVIGMLAGGGYMLATNGLPTDFAGWFGVVIYGLALGLVASGVYDAGRSIVRGRTN
jgi:hypothetical protein